MSMNSCKEESLNEEKNIFQPLSPVFKVCINRTGKNKKKTSLTQASKISFDKYNLDSDNIKIKNLSVNEELNNSLQNDKEIFNFEDDSELLNSSFSQLDKFCNNLLNEKQKSDNSKFSKSFVDVFLRKKRKKLHFDYLQFLKSLAVKKQFYANTIDTKLELAQYNISDLFLDCFKSLEILKESNRDNSKCHLYENKIEKNNLNKHIKKEVTLVKKIEMCPEEALQKKNLFLEPHSCKNNYEAPSIELSALTSNKNDSIRSKEFLVFKEIKTDKKFISKKCFSTSKEKQSGPIKLCDNVEKLINNNNQVSNRQDSDFLKVQFNDVVGFSTASGVTLTATKKSLEKAKKLMAKWNEVEDFPNEDEKGLSKVKKYPVSTSIKEPNKNDVGFSTASGVKLSATKESLEKAQKLMSEWNEFEDFPHKNEENLNKAECLSGFSNTKLNKEVVGFSTASGVKLSATKESLKKAQKLMAEWNEFEDFPHKNKENLNKAECLPSFSNKVVGFSTASGVKLSATKNSLEKAQKLMSEWNFNEELENLKIPELNNTSDSVAFEQGLSKISRVSTQQIKEKNILLDDLKSDDLNKSFSNSLKNYSFHTPFLDVKTQDSLLNFSIENCDKIDLSNLSDKENRFKSEELDIFVSSNEKSHSFVPKVTKKGFKRNSIEFDTPTKKIKYSDEEKNCRVSGELFNVLEKRAVARLNQEIIIEEKENVNSITGSLLTKKIFSQQSKKKTSVYKLFSDLNTTEDMFINLSDAANYKFVGPDFFGSACTENVEGFMLDDFFNIIPDDENNFGVEEFKRGFLAGPGVQPNLIPKNWIENHYKWIIWKMVYYKKAFQNCLLNVLTPNNVMLQLKYRYDREIDKSERSALKKILEKDDTSAKKIVLRICEINQVIIKNGLEYELNLSDGWYSCPAKIDLAMVRLIEKERIKVGMKIITQGAILCNCEQGVSPLELTKDIHLKIFTNSTRPAKINAKLGFQKDPGYLTMPIRSLLPDGGQISRIKIIVVRIYPLLFMEKTQSGRYIVRNGRSEEKADFEYKRILEQKTEKIYDEVRSEIENELVKKKRKLVLCHSQEDDCVDLFKVTNSQDLRKEMTSMVEEKLKKCLSRRNVTQFLRLKIVDLKKPNFMKPVLLTIWNPNEELIKNLFEGVAMSIMNVNFGNSLRSMNKIQINTTKHTEYIKLPQNCHYPVRHLTSLESIYSDFNPYFDEVDLVGITVIENIKCSSELNPNIFLVDLDFNFVRISSARNYEDHCWKSILSHGTVVACSNLQWNGNAKKQVIPVLFVTETTVLTENPKHFHLKEGIEKLKKGLPKDVHSFVAICQKELIKKLYKRLTN